MSDNNNNDEIPLEPADPLAGADASVAKVGERLQEKADDVEAAQEDADDADVANGEG